MIFFRARQAGPEGRAAGIGCFNDWVDMIRAFIIHIHHVQCVIVIGAFWSLPLGTVSCVWAGFVGSVLLPGCFGVAWYCVCVFLRRC